MARLSVDAPTGIIQDIAPNELPPNVWTAGRNVRMRDGAVVKANGYEDLWSNGNQAPYFLMPVQTPVAYYWLYATLSGVYVIQGQYHFDISGSTYNASTRWRWTGTNLGGVVVLNNGIDVPQYWAFPSSHTTLLADLTNWPATDRARTVRAYKNYLIATNVDRSGVNYPTMVKWSHGADIGAIPSSWAIDDPTLDSGETLLPQQGGDILDQRVLRDINVLYRNESTWAMQYVGAPAIFRFWSLFDTSGILCAGMVEEFLGKHFVVTADDIVVHDGQNVQSVANNRVRRAFFDDLDEDYYDNSFLVHNRKQKEMWVCYPSDGNTLPNRAWVWNYADDNWAVRDLPSISCAAYGVLDPLGTDAWEAGQGAWYIQPDTWASATGSTWVTQGDSWESDDLPWNFRSYNAQNLGMIFGDPTNLQLYQGDSTNQNDGSNMTAYIQRTGLTIPEKMYNRKQINAVYPRIDGTEGGVINCYVGKQDAIGGTVTWSAAKEYTIGTSYKVDFNTDARLIAVKFESTTDIEWRLSGYTMDLEISGNA